jgi:hypothetical protein
MMTHVEQVGISRKFAEGHLSAELVVAVKADEDIWERRKLKRLGG